MGSPSEGGGNQRVALMALPQVPIALARGIELFAFAHCRPRRSLRGYNRSSGLMTPRPPRFRTWV